MGERSNDSCLMIATRNGNQQAFETLVGRYNRALLCYASGMVGEDRAQDTMQVVWTKVWQWSTDETKQIPEQVKPWLYSITRNYSLNVIRDHKTACLLADDDHISNHDLVHHAVATKQRTRDMFVVLNELPSRQKQALMMHASGDYSHQQIAAHMQESPDVVRGLIFRARSSVRQRSLAWAGVLPFPFLAKQMQKWQHADQLGTAAITGGAVGGGGAVVMGSSKVATLVAAGTIALGGGAAAVVQHAKPDVLKTIASSAAATIATHHTIIAANPVSPPSSNSLRPRLQLQTVAAIKPPASNKTPIHPDVLAPAGVDPQDQANVLVPLNVDPQDQSDVLAPAGVEPQDQANVLVPAETTPPQPDQSNVLAPASVPDPAPAADSNENASSSESDAAIEDPQSSAPASSEILPEIHDQP